MEDTVSVKWTELRNYFSDLHRESLESENWRSESCLREIVESFENDWENASDFYGEYFDKKT